MRAWARETSGSSTRMSAPSSRPTSITGAVSGNSTVLPSGRSQTSREGAGALTSRARRAASGATDGPVVVEERGVLEAAAAAR